MYIYTYIFLFFWGGVLEQDLLTTPTQTKKTKKKNPSKRRIFCFFGGFLKQIVAEPRPWSDSELHSETRSCEQGVSGSGFRV